MILFVILLWLHTNNVNINHGNQSKITYYYKEISLLVITQRYRCSARDMAIKAIRLNIRECEIQTFFFFLYHKYLIKNWNTEKQHSNA